MTQVDLKKLDARIQKLQEIRRIAADPELVSMLLEFLVNEGERAEAVVANGDSHTESSVPTQEDLDIVNHVLKGIDGQGNGLWNSKRA